jgi:hypothetical protein
MERETRRSAALGRLDELVGRWELQATVEGQRMAGGRTSFDWIEDGAFLVQHADADTIVARWEKSRDGSSWELDFELT